MPILEVLGMVILAASGAAGARKLSKDAEESEKQNRLLTAPQWQPPKPKAKRKLTPEEKERRRLKRQENRQRLEQERQKKEAARQAKIETERQEAEKRRIVAATMAAVQARAATEERARAEQAIVQWENEQLGKKPTLEQIAIAIEEANSIQSHHGTYVHAIALTSSTGFVVEWKIHAVLRSVPLVTGLRGNERMFSERSFVGRHAARLPPGRYELIFMVDLQNRQSNDGPDLAFEIYIPTGGRRNSADYFKNAVDSKTQEFTNRAKILSQAKKQYEEVLATHTNNPKEIKVEMSKFEYELGELNRAERGQE